MGFFKKGGGQSALKKRKTKDAPPAAAKKSRKQLALENTEVSSESEDFSADERDVSEHSEGEYEDAQAKSFRDAKALLQSVRAEERKEDTDEEDAAIAHRLKEDAQAKYAVLHKKVAESVEFDEDNVLTYRPHRFSPVCVAVSKDGRYVVSCSKDGSVVKYDIEAKKKCGVLQHSKQNTRCHKGQVNAVAISPDEKFVVTGGVDKAVKVWRFDTLEHVKDLGTHRGAITSLAFRSGTDELFSSSVDRSIKAWDLGQMGFVDTMFGHQDVVQQIDMLSRARVLSCGAQDRTVRLFKVAEESQLVFNGFQTAVSIDTVAMINEDHFVSGCADGSIYVWSVARKKPVCVEKEAHGRDDATGQPYWICSVAACKYTDLIASGSHDGILKLWKVADDYKSIRVVDEFELEGFVNHIRFTEGGRKLVCAVGQEHKNGRWWKEVDAKNSIVVIPLQYSVETKA
ncbi:U3 small nucleolar RNA interacting protein 2 [Aphelenchoides avenae]|nr:U3 small nucleolar RNA interacting protein 2 [Aphelenchus avenae]